MNQVHKWCKSISETNVYHKTEDDIYIELPEFGNDDKLDRIDIAALPAFSAELCISQY